MPLVNWQSTPCDPELNPPAHQSLFRLMSAPASRRTSSIPRLRAARIAGEPNAATGSLINLEPGFKVVIIAFMKATYTIGSLAKAARIPTSTVRYYERRGLLEPQSRSHANYRVYDEQAVRRLHFVRSAQAAGFTLSDIAVLLRFRDGDAAPCRRVQDLITTRLKVVARQIEQLRGVDGMLHGWLRVCRRTEKSGRCGLLEGLADSANSCCQLPRMPS